MSSIHSKGSQESSLGKIGAIFTHQEYFKRFVVNNYVFHEYNFVSKNRLHVFSYFYMFFYILYPSKFVNLQKRAISLFPFQFFVNISQVAMNFPTWFYPVSFILVALMGLGFNASVSVSFELLGEMLFPLPTAPAIIILIIGSQSGSDKEF